MKRCLFIAPLVSHASGGRIAALGSGSYELHAADVSTRPLRHGLDLYPFSLIRGHHHLDVSKLDPMFQGAPGYRTMIHDTLRSRGLLPENRAISARVRQLVEQVEPSVVVVFHTAIAIHFARIVRKFFPDLPVVIIHNTIPTTLERKDRCRRTLTRPLIPEFVDYNHWLRKLDFAVYASEEMAEFAKRRFDTPEDRMAILPDYLPRSMHVKAFRSPDSGRDGVPRVIFLGAPERWGATTIDNLDGEFLSLAAEKITVYSGEMSKSVLDTGYGFKYPYFSDTEVYGGRLGDYAHGFDAALITYGVKERRERFRTTLPTRFFTALTAGIPLAVRAGMFDSVESYVNRHGMGFAYQDPTDLKRKLADRDRMSEYRANAYAHSRGVSGENQAPQFDLIFDALSQPAREPDRRGTLRLNGRSP